MLDPGGGGGAGYAAGVAIGASMSAFARSAASGAFAVNETGGAAILAAIRNMKDRLDELRIDSIQFSQQAPLGQSNAAVVMSDVDARVAQDDQGFVPMLLKLRESLESAEQGVNDAMRNYAAMDERGAARQRSSS